MKFKETCLTSVALSGQRKRDAETLFSKSVAEFLQNEGHAKANYIRTSCNWHIPSDGCGES